MPEYIGDGLDPFKYRTGNATPTSNTPQGDNKPDTCNKSVSWWDGEYEGTCELPEGHAGPHYDGISCFDDEGDEVELKTQPPRPIHYSIGYYKAGKPYYVHNQVLDNQNRIIEFQPEPGVAVRIEVRQ